MTNREAIEFLKNIIDSKAVTLIDNDFTARYHIEALEKAIKSLEKEAKRVERRAKIKAKKEKIEALATFYEDLKEGELFRITSVLKDKRVYRRDKDGATQIVDSYGNCCNYKDYPYLKMIVYRLEEADNGS